MEHVRWLAEPNLQRPTVLAAFTGWNDAGDAASNAVRHLIDGWGAQPLAEIDPEEFTDFATVRPHVRLADRRTRSIVWPTVGLWSASVPGGDVIIVLGPEPALRWRMFTQQIVGVAHRYSASLVLSMGSLFADVPHTRPVQLIGTATDDSVIDRFELQRSRYEGPTGIVGVLMDAAGRSGLATASLWAAVPAYASQVPSPKASLALISPSACDMLGTPTPIGQLDADAAEYKRRVTALVHEDDDLLNYVARLETMSEHDDEDDDDQDDTVGGELGEDTAPLAESDLDSDDLMAEVERFLHDQPES